MATKHSITLDKAKQLTKKYRDNKKKILKDEYGNKPTLPICETFERAAFEELLAVPGCVSIRAYFGMAEDLNVNLIFVAVNDKNEDILPQVDTTMMMRTSDDVPIIDEGTRCPSDCPPPSSLN
jgi:hypothetical protein